MFSTLAVLAGCHVGPNFTRPEAPPAARYTSSPLALEATDQNVIGDPLHIRAVKPRGATTREAAIAISERRAFSECRTSPRSK